MRRWEGDREGGRVGVADAARGRFGPAGPVGVAGSDLAG